MDKINDGGPAFPFVEPSTECNVANGMSLRDYLAAKAMVGFIADTNVRISNDRECDMAARASYRMADAMLRARGAA